MKRHLCTKCRKKRKEKFLKPIRNSDKPGSKVWICNDGCLDGRLSEKVQSFLQDRQSHGRKGQSSLKNGLSPGSMAVSNDDHKLSKSNADLQRSNVPGNKVILDVCCGNRMFWFNKNHPNAIYQDIKSSAAAVKSVQDFRNIKYKDKSFNLVVFDPPHIFKKHGKYSWLNDRYGTLSIEEWPMDIKKGFDECMRVLKDYGVLIFKWSEGSLSVSTILSVIQVEPLFGHTSDKKNRTHWMCFMKIPSGH